MPLEQPVIRIDRWVKRVFPCGAVADSASGRIILCSRAARQRSDGEAVTTSGKTSTSVFRRAWVVLSDSVGHLNADDGWAMASHVALSGLMALFPFLIFVAALAGFVGQERLAEQVADLLFQSPAAGKWAGPIADEVHCVVGGAGVNLLTHGGLSSRPSSLPAAWRRRALPSIAPTASSIAGRSCGCGPKAFCS